MTGARIYDNGVVRTITVSGYAVACTTCTAAATRTLSVDGSQLITGSKYCFNTWSNGKPRTHTIALAKDSTIALNLVSSGSGPTNVLAGATLYDDAFDCRSPYKFQGFATLKTSNPADTFRVWGSNVKFRFRTGSSDGLNIDAPFVATGAAFETMDSTAVNATNLWYGIRLGSSASIKLTGCAIRNAGTGVEMKLNEKVALVEFDGVEFSSNVSDVRLTFDHLRNPQARIVRNTFGSAPRVDLTVGGTSLVPVGSLTFADNYFAVSPKNVGWHSLGITGGWHGQILRNTFKVTTTISTSGIDLFRYSSYGSPACSLGGNRFVVGGTDRYALRVAPGPVQQIYAYCNDWGVYTSGEIEAIIRHKVDDGTLAEVFFQPFMGQIGCSAPIGGGGGGGGGCPFVLTEDNGAFAVENSILGRSELSGGIPSFVSDAYPLRATRANEAGRVRVRVAELESEIDELDELRLVAIATGGGHDIGTDPSGHPVVFTPTVIPLRQVAWTGKGEPFVSPIAPTQAYRGESGDSLEFQTGEDDGTAIGQKRIGINLIPKPTAAPFPGSPTGVTIRVSAAVDGDEWMTLTPVIPRENWSIETLPLDVLGDRAVRRIRVIWHTQHTLGWIGLVDAAEVQAQALPTLSAAHSSGRSVLEELGIRDGQKVTLGPGEYVELEFDASKVAEDSRYVLLAHGRYFRQASGEAAAAPLVHFLAQNRPNPFNPETAIGYGLPQPSHVTLRIYNVAGRLVRALVDGPKPAGVHVSRWDARDDRGLQVSSGVYFYELKAGQFQSRRRMVLLR